MRLSPGVRGAVRCRGACTGLRGGGGVRAFLAKNGDGSNGLMAGLGLNRLILGSPTEEEIVSFWDKLLGRGKKTAGEATGDSSLRSEGVHQEQEGMAEERAESAENKAQAAREEAAEHRAQRENP